MIELFLASENLPFSVALVLLFGIALLEGITTFIGFGFSQFLENLLPDTDIPHMDIDVDADIGMETPSILTRLLGWIRIKGVPMIVVLVVFLTVFSLSGFIVQAIIKSIIGFYLPWFIAMLPAFFITIPIVKASSLILSNFVIKDETSALKTETFVGKIAVITLGNARKGMPAEAKLTDTYGQVHYIRVEPDEDDEVLEQSAEVLLIKKQGHIFKAIKMPDLRLTGN